MSGTVAQTQVSAFTSPSNGDALDATIVKANDNATRTAHNTHDADATIHVQTSLLAGRPAASTAGRLWVTSDGLRMYYDTGSAWNELAYLPLAGGTLTGGLTGTTATFSGAGAFAGLTVSGAGLSVAAGGAAITGASTFANGVTLNSTLGVAGATTLSGTLGVTGVSTLSGGAQIGGSGLSVSASGATITGGVSVPSGASTFNGTTAFGAAVTVNSTLGVTSTATLSGALAHTGTTLGFYGKAPHAKITVTAPGGGSDALALLLLAALGDTTGIGLIHDA